MPHIFGFGTTIMLDTASDTLTFDSNLGPVTVDRPDVNLTDMQVVIRYRKSALTNIGMAPNWQLRFLFVPVTSAPERSRRPWFGG